MTITTTNKRNDYIANGSQTEFNFTFPVLYEVGNTPKYSLKVIVTDTNLVETVKTENVDYTVSYDAETLLGKIIFNTAPTNLYKVTLLPNVNLKQENDYTKSGTDKLSGEVLELSLDKLTLICIQLSEKVDRMLGLPEGSTLQNLKLPNINSSVANQLLSINSTGNGITTKVATDINLATVSNYIKTLFDDETSSQARTTLDAQQLNANLTALAGLTGSANKIPYFTGVGVMALIDNFSNRNLLINGAMSIDQRNAGSSQTITAGSSLAYTIDRWYAYCTGANVVGQRIAGSSPNQYNYRFTGASSVTKIGFAQRIEAINSQHLAGKTASLSVDLSNSLLTTVTWTMFYANTVDTFGSLASPTRTQISTGTFTVNSTLTRYNTSISIPSNATTGIEIEFSVGSQTSGTFTIGRTQLELGSVATDFDYRNIQQEIALCQRYFEKTYNLEIALGTNTNIGARINSFQNLLGNGSSSQFYSHFLSVRKRATPSIVLYSIAGTVGKATQDDGSEINSSAGNISELSFYTTSINTSGRYSATQHFVATSEL